MYYFKGLYDSMNQCFPKDQCIMLKTSFMVKGPFQMQDWPMDLNITVQSFIDIFQILHGN